ncbi:ATP synthase epsilon chain [Dehalobacter sp. UNSWDHB]|jgi:ATP synthase, F1 epsilon subunit (delta in mitochondria)|uniref:F0F1 ATP synthase subunit epsilon n=1 Tax=unclassified Dehalobacter TaxID=2635733 RepID=UPI00028A81EC|nr:MULTISPECIES: F0F1 ATP synthase subunit epsilon [unclassified Dehalobacter]AFV03901.1 ATP synthase epsilon chain [Dehalobacter sp. DCA]AFV06880.1 ATP synthase epsilon chain [Dehalobacter sp. CF]EQB21389.1 ATP synthase epsilon chain [Dehalobacter sp. UNSWDHB]
MAGTFNFVVVAPAGEVLNTEVEFVLAPGAEGELGILANHSPLIANLVIGVVRYTQNGKVEKMAIGGGFLEVAQNKATILANTAELAESIDVARAEAAKERAEKRLGEKQAETDMIRAEVALKRAVARLRAIEK